MSVRIYPHLHGRVAGAARRVYYAAFPEGQDGSLTRAQLAEIWRDHDVGKYIGLSRDNTVLGVAALTNILVFVKAKSYFALRFPQLYREQRIWYCPFVGVLPELAEPFAFPELIGAMSATVREHGGILVIDACSYNGDRRVARAERTHSHLIRLVGAQATSGPRRPADVPRLTDASRPHGVGDRAR